MRRPQTCTVLLSTLLLHACRHAIMCESSGNNILVSTPALSKYGDRQPTLRTTTSRENMQMVADMPAQTRHQKSDKLRARVVKQHGIGRRVSHEQPSEGVSWLCPPPTLEDEASWQCSGPGSGRRRRHNRRPSKRCASRQSTRSLSRWAALV